MSNHSRGPTFEQKMEEPSAHKTKVDHSLRTKNIKRVDLVEQWTAACQGTNREIAVDTIRIR
jgi:hypothetical protein